MAITGKLKVNDVKSAEPGRYGDGGGLWLTVRSDGTKSWSFRYTFRERKREMGLGAFSSVPLAKARKKAARLREQLADEKDPIEVKRAKLRNRIPTFAECAVTHIKRNKGAWRNARTLQIWESFIEKYANPVIGKIPVDQIVTDDIKKILDPIWYSKTTTADRLRRMIEAVLNSTKAKKHREGVNPATWRGNLKGDYPEPLKVSPPKNMKAFPWETVAEFMRDLKKREGAGARALELLVLTAVRSGGVRHLLWSEIDLDCRVWTIPKAKTKTGKRDHSIPLSDQAIELLNSLDRIEGVDLVFPSDRNTPISDMTISAVCKRMKAGCVPHGFRSTFKDWAAETTNFENIVSEMALEHAVNNSVEAKYRRGDLFEKRKLLMQAWADYLDMTPVESATVTPIGRASNE